MLFLPWGLCLALPQSATVGLFAATVFLGTTTLDPLPPSSQPIPVLEVIKVYGKLAGPDCYGKIAPKGSSCQVTLKDVERTFHLDDQTSTKQATFIISQEKFRDDLNRAEFQWPLKPYGVDKSLSKTATMNKGAETKVFMDQLEDRGLYDKRNPTGPLPTSLRPQLNRVLQQEGVEPVVSDRVFRSLGGQNGQLRVEQLKQFFSDVDGIDYYGFLELIGKDSITWPY
jgi:hypothetical protein